MTKAMEFVTSESFLIGATSLVLLLVPVGIIVAA